MIDRSNLDVLAGSTAYDIDGKKIGSVGQVYVNSISGEPAWLTIRTGLFGTGESFVPVADATLKDDDIRVGYSKDFVKDAPRVDADGELAQQDTDALYSYYDLGALAKTETDGSTDGSRNDASGHDTDSTMTRSEEHLRVGTEQVETGRARLRKYVVTEQETVTVPVSHEEVRMVSEPITEDNIGDVLGGPAISEEEHEVVLTGDRIVADTEAIPVERVRLETETHSGQETVTGEVRKEKIDLDDDGDPGADSTSPRV